MTKQYFVTSRETCPQCEGNKYIQHPLWAEYWKVRQEEGEIDDFMFWSERSYQSPPPEEILCDECDGRGVIEKEENLLEAMNELLPHAAKVRQLEQGVIDLEGNVSDLWHQGDYS